METLQQRIMVAARSSELARLRRGLRELCGDCDVDPGVACRLVLAVDEHLANVIEHSGLDPETPIELRLEVGEGEITAEIEDGGRPFDPTRGRQPQPAGRRRAKRGYGLYLIRSVCDGVSYRRTAEGTNVLTLTMKPE